MHCPMSGRWQHWLRVKQGARLGSNTVLHRIAARLRFLPTRKATFGRLAVRLGVSRCQESHSQGKKQGNSRMDSQESTALVVLVPEAETLVQAFRDQYDLSAAEGMPAH